MIEFTTTILPTQYVVLRIPMPDAGWGDGTKISASGTDSINSQTFTAETTELGAAAVLRVGPFIQGSTASLLLTLSDIDDAPVAQLTQDLLITNNNSPGVIVRQAIYDILASTGITNAMILTDGEFKPASAYEDIPFVGAEIVIEIGAPSTTKHKKTSVRSECPCTLTLTVYVFGQATSQSFVTADNTAWEIQSVIDDTRNLNLAGLGVNNFSWSWDSKAPDVVEVQGTPFPVVTQELTLSVPVIWITAPQT